MVKLYDKGVYLLNGTEIVESCEEVAVSAGISAVDALIFPLMDGSLVSPEIFVTVTTAGSFVLISIC